MTHPLTPAEAVQRLRRYADGAPWDNVYNSPGGVVLMRSDLTAALSTLEAQPNYPEIPDSSRAQPVAGGVDWPERSEDLATLAAFKIETRTADLVVVGFNARIDRIIAHLSPTPDVGALVAAAKPFAEAAAHLHPSISGDATTLDGIEVRYWRAISAAISPFVVGDKGL